MRRLVFVGVLFLAMISIADAASFGSAKKAAAEKEDYFKSPGHDVLFVIEGVNLIDRRERPDEAVEVQLTISAGNDTSTDKTRTPCVMRFPMDEVVANMLSDYNKPNTDRQKFLLDAALYSPTIVILAQSQASYAGISGHVYYAGKEVLSDKSAVEYGAINLSYTLPLKEILEAQK